MEAKQTYQIPTALGTTLPLTGQGLEQIADPITGEVIARFWNGNFVTVTHSHSQPRPAALMEESTVALLEIA